MRSGNKYTPSAHLQSPAPIRADSVYACLPALIAGTASHAVVTLFVKESHDIAAAYLRVANSSVRSLLSRLNLSADDAAYDAIAELFSRDPDSSFPVLARWWKKLPPSCTSSEAETALAVRRLVVGAVHQRVFGMYRDSDPQMAKILRNIKLALKRHPRVRQVAVGRDTVITHRSASSLRPDLPPMPHELLLPGVFDALVPGAGLKDILDAIGEALLQLKGYRGYISLVEAAIIVRDVYAADSRMHPDATPIDSFTSEDIAALVESTLADKRGTLFSRYERRGILTPEEGRAHSRAVGDILRRICLDGPSDEPYFAVLKQYLPFLTTEQYRKRHRSILEYLVRKATLIIRARIQNQEL
jgi:hypothetical protein